MTAKLTARQLSPERLYEIASQVLGQADSVTSNDCQIAYDAGLVERDGDCDGIRPAPTGLYIELMDQFDPMPDYLISN